MLINFFCGSFYCDVFFVAPVSFSIKKSKDDAPKEIKSALPVEESSDEDEGGEKMVETPSTTPPPPPEQEKPSTDVAIETKKNGLLDEDDPILEMIDLTEDIEDRRDVKRGKEKKSKKKTFVKFFIIVFS